MLDKDIETKINKALELMQNDTEIALSIFDEILENYPDNIDALNGKGSTLIKLNQFNEAEKYFDKSLAITETSSALINKGLISKHNHEYQKAIDYYNKAIQINKNLKNIILILKNEVLKLIDDSSQINPNNYTQKANELIKKGLSLKNENKLWDALESYYEAISEDHTCKNSVNMLVNDIKTILEHEFLFETPEFKDNEIDNLKIQSFRALLVEENPKKALTLLNLILEIKPDDIEALNHKGCILFRFDRCPESVESFNKCLEINNKYYYALFNKAIVLRRMNNLEESLSCFNELLEIPKYHNKAEPYQLEILDKCSKQKISENAFKRKKKR